MDKRPYVDRLPCSLECRHHACIAAGSMVVRLSDRAAPDPLGVVVQHMNDTLHWTSRPTCSEYEGSKRDRDHYHQYMTGERCVAVVFWIGGHVERPDEWNVRVAGHDHTISAYGDLASAKQAAERDWFDAADEPKENLATTPEDRLWLEILLCDPETRGLDPAKARETLHANGFPARLIETYLAAR